MSVTVTLYCTARALLAACDCLTNCCTRGSKSHRLLTTQPIINAKCSLGRISTSLCWSRDLISVAAICACPRKKRHNKTLTSPEGPNRSFSHQSRSAERCYCVRAICRVSSSVLPLCAKQKHRRTCLSRSNFSLSIGSCSRA